MKFEASKKDLLQALELATRFVSKSSTLPILENVAIVWKVDVLEIKATDMNKFISITLPANIHSEWWITVNAKMLFDAIKITDSDDILMEGKDDGTLFKIISWSDKFEFVAIPINEYVAVPEIENDEVFVLDAWVLSKGIERVESSIPDKSFNTIITWMLLKSTWDYLAFVWTDSFRLAEYKVTEKLWREFSLVIPKYTLSEIRKVSDLAVADESYEVKVKEDGKKISFSYKVWNFDILIKTNLLLGEYPSYEKIILPEYNFKIIVDANLLEKAIRKVSLFSKDISYFTKFIPEEDKLIISSWETDLGEWTTQIPAIFEGDYFSFWVNWKSILDFLKYVEGEEVIFNVYDDEKPILIKDQWDENYRFIIRPLKE